MLLGWPASAAADGEAGVFPFLQIAICFNVAVFAFNFYLELRQRRALRLPKPPEQVAHLYTPERFAAQQAYNLDRSAFGMVDSAWGVVLNNALLLWGFLPRSWGWAGALLQASGMGLSGEVWQTIAWVLLTSAVSLVMGLPWSVYRTFYLEQRHGFNKTTPATFVLDTLKGVALGLVFLPPIVAGLTLILQRSSPFIAVYLWAFTFALSLFMMTIYPTLIAPLFNKFTPLEQGPLREKIEALAASLKFPLRKLFVIDGSKRSAHSNAYMYGFGKAKRIVLFDTLIDQCTEEQVVAVLAHELGHWKLRHTPMLLAVGQLVVLAQMGLYTLIRSSPQLYRSFGFSPGSLPVMASLILFSELIGPVDEVVNFAANCVTRLFEFQADRFGVQLGRGAPLKEALCVLDKENKSPPNLDPLYSAYHLTHPPLPERLRAIDAEMKRAAAAGKKGQ